LCAPPLEIDPEAALLIGGLAHGVPREMVKLSKRISDLALAKRVSRIDQAFVRTAREAYGIDDRGLGPIEQKALRVLERNGKGRPMGIARWVAASGLCGSVLRQICEPALLRLGLIAVTPRGRMAVA
jgi:Holliday junction DNA helicase RuvB